MLTAFPEVMVTTFQASTAYWRWHFQKQRLLKKESGYLWIFFFLIWLKRCSDRPSTALQFLVQRFSAAAGAAQTMSRHKLMGEKKKKKKHTARATAGVAQGPDVAVSEIPFVFPKHTQLPPAAGGKAGAGPGPQQHRVVCAPSAGPAAAARPSAPLRAPAGGEREDELPFPRAPSAERLKANAAI